MIIKFNCHSSFGVDGKHYLLKFISRQARILSSSLKSEPRITNERVVRGRHEKAKPLFIILTRQFAGNIPVDSVTLDSSRAFIRCIPDKRLSAGGCSQPGMRMLPPPQGCPDPWFLTLESRVWLPQGRECSNPMICGACALSCCRVGSSLPAGGNRDPQQPLHSPVHFWGSHLSHGNLASSSALCCCCPPVSDQQMNPFPAHKHFVLWRAAGAVPAGIE